MVKGTEVEELPEIVSYLKIQLRKLGVRTQLNTAVTTELIEEIKADAVVIAIGSTLTIPDIPGINKKKVVSNITLHKNAKLLLRYFSPKLLRHLTKFYLPFGKSVVVIGGLIHGLELAEFLVKRGRQVTVVETSDQLGSGMHDINKNRLIPWLVSKGVTILTEVEYKEIKDKGLVITTKEDEEKTIEVDSVAIATLPAANNELFNALKSKGKEVYLIGDSKAPRTILDAISDGFNTGLKI
jgi:pyruvate/2-oxoglutarate dehydrogenase complex dihydrolipoamide dehydrogenase (E3) component